MLELYYTGAQKFNAMQTDPDLSLGGFISCSLIPNAYLGNLFGDLSKSVIANNQNESRVFAVKNVSGNTISNFQAYFNYPTSDGEQTNDAFFQIGWLTPSVDECGDVFSEKLPNRFARPLTVTNFQQADGPTQPIPLPDLEDDGYVVIYLIRELTERALTPPTTEECLDILNGDLTLDTVENIDLVFDWS